MKPRYKVVLNEHEGQHYFWWSQMFAKESLSLYHHTKCPHICKDGTIEECCACAGKTLWCPICRLGG
jgi:hypothetical protein